MIIRIGSRDIALHLSIHIHQVIEKYAKTLCILNPHKEPVGEVFFKKIHNIKSLLTNVVLTEEESDTLENLVDLADAVKYPAENTANNDDNVLYSCDAELFLKNNSTLINDIFTKIKTKIKSECETYKFELNLFYKAMQGQFIDATAKTGNLLKTNTRDDLTLVDDKHKKQASKTMLSWFKTQEESDKENINIGFRLFER